MACDPILQPVPRPPVTRKTDARLAYLKSDAALEEANDRLTMGGECVRDERAAYSRKELPK